LLLYWPVLQLPYLVILQKQHWTFLIETRSLQYEIESSSHEPIRFTISGRQTPWHHQCCHCCLFLCNALLWLSCLE
jgi:hypothetical protein